MFDEKVGYDDGNVSGRSHSIRNAQGTRDDRCCESGRRFHPAPSARLSGRSTVGYGPPRARRHHRPGCGGVRGRLRRGGRDAGGVALPITRGVPHGRSPPLTQRNTLRPLQIGTPAGWPDMASTRTCADPWMCVGWTWLRKLAPVWNSPRTPGQRRRRPAMPPGGTARQGGGHRGT
jgi:hypothetical protein